MVTPLSAIIEAAENLIKDFKENDHNPDGVIELLRYFLKQETNLTLEDNPIYLGLSKVRTEDLKFLIQEYAQFSNEAIHMLLDARIRNADWPLLKEEIDRNIEEEMGSATKHVPHLEIMRLGYRGELGIETDNIPVSRTTRTFLARMRRIFKDDDNAYSAGALLAFEGTAITEFYIVDEIIKKYIEQTGRTYQKGNVKSYIDGHKLFEIGHEEGLMKTIQPYITKENMKDFVRGYVSVLLVMSTWWEGLANDINVGNILNIRQE